MAGQRLSPKELEAVFKSKAASPPNKENELLVRHLKCKESLELAVAITNAISRSNGHGTRMLPTPSEILPEIWKKCSEDALTFAQYAITNAIGAKTGDLLQRNVEYHLEVSDVVGTDNACLSTGQLQVSISCGGCGYLKIGPALRALEVEAEGLGTAFYWILIRSLYRVMRIYDHSDAQNYEENLIEYAEADDETNRDQYEFPEVEKALPECIRTSLKGEPKLWRLQYRRLIERYRSGKFAAWIRHLLVIQKHTRIRNYAQNVSEPGNDDGPPLPSFLIVFEDRDAISACFDEESQHMLEGTSEPTLCAVFSPNNADEFARASRAVARFVRISQEVCELIEAIQKWEKNSHEGGGSDRRGASLRAA